MCHRRRFSIYIYTFHLPDYRDFCLLTTGSPQNFYDTKVDVWNYRFPCLRIPTTHRDRPKRHMVGISVLVLLITLNTKVLENLNSTNKDPRLIEIFLKVRVFYSTKPDDRTKVQVGGS